MEQADFRTEVPSAGTCIRIVLDEGAHAVKSPADGCEADSASSCLVLMPGDEAQAFSPARVDKAFGDFKGDRTGAPLSPDGTCPLACP